jgi:general secretion pathway protein E
MPSIHGESVVIRLLDDRGRTLDFSSLGLAPEAEETLRKCLVMPNGMVLVTGPTGSGKTTLLYAALDLLNIPDRKILTVEDPIEYQIPGINQTQVKPDIGLGFANVLRNIVRHDPEIIMVGEMRDRETAQMAVHAALTGHLVLTTLHTNTAVGAITRLIDMEIEPFLLTSTIRAMVAQRLVRVLCPDCREPYPAPIEFAELAEQRGLHVGSNATLYKPVGCEECGGIGYLGRIGIFELVTMTQNLRDAVRVGVGTSELHQVARRDGFVTMFEDGLRKCLSGVTTIDEIGRVIEDW